MCARRAENGGAVCDASRVRLWLPDATDSSVHARLPDHVTRGVANVIAIVDAHRLDMVPLLMEQYKPSGWLGMIMGESGVLHCSTLCLPGH